MQLWSGKELHVSMERGAFEMRRSFAVATWYGGQGSTNFPSFRSVNPRVGWDVLVTEVPHAVGTF